jgi:lipoyl(octanoyl) transferase
MVMHATQLCWYWLGRCSYQSALALQHQVRAQVLLGQTPGAIVLAEHSPVITLGRSANREHVLTDRAALDAAGIDLVAIDRGGDVTYHGPGQLMVYPVIRIKSLLRYLETVAQSVVDLLEEMGVAGATWRRDPAGVWVGSAKIAACGVHLARSVTTHGFAINVATPSQAWRHIVPCGLTTPVCSASQLLANTPNGRVAFTTAQAAAWIGPRLCQSLRQ